MYNMVTHQVGASLVAARPRVAQRSHSINCQLGFRREPCIYARDPHLSKSAHEPFRPPFYPVAVHSAGNVLSCVQRLQHPLLDVLHDLVALNLHLKQAPDRMKKTRKALIVVDGRGFRFQASPTTRRPIIEEICTASTSCHTKSSVSSIYAKRVSTMTSVDVVFPWCDHQRTAVLRNHDGRLLGKNNTHYRHDSIETVAVPPSSIENLSLPRAKISTIVHAKSRCTS